MAYKPRQTTMGPMSIQIRSRHSTTAHFANDRFAPKPTLPQKGPGIWISRLRPPPPCGLTALQALRDEFHVKPGQKMFISGGAGGVGIFAIQIAKWLGAHMTTTASQRGETLVRSLGCDEVIDYTFQDISKMRARFDAGFDLIGGKTLEQMFEIMKPGTKIVSVAAIPTQTAIRDLGGRRALSAIFWLISYGISWTCRRQLSLSLYASKR